MKNIIIIGLIALINVIGLHAQDDVLISCGTDEIHLNNLKSDLYKKKFERSNRDWSHFAKNYTEISALRNSESEVATLNLVVHDISSTNTFLNTPSGEMSDYQYIIDGLNTVFGGTNLNGIPGNETNIRFCLAIQDINNDTYTIDDVKVENIPEADGLNSSNPADIYALSVAGQTASRFPTNKFTNIYIVDEIEHFAGFAYLPSSHGNSRDGIYIQRSFLVNDATFSNNIVVLIHEIGHYLGLFHTFGICTPEGPIEEECSCTNDNCLFDGDMICDTPPNISQTTGYTCDTPPNTCVDLIPSISDGNHPLVEVVDQKENYMDYGFANCKFLFTLGQIQRMCFMIDPEYGPRKSLLGQSYCVSCLDLDECVFSVEDDLIDHTMVVNTTETFDIGIEDCILDPSPDMTYEWELENLTTGSAMMTFTGENITFTALEIGNHKISVSASLTSNSNCVEEICFEFQVVPESIPENCLEFQDVNTWDTWDRVSYTGGWALDTDYSGTWDASSADPADYAHPSTNRATDDASVNPNFEIVNNLDADPNFSAISEPANVSNFIRVGRTVNESDPLLDGAANYVSMTLNPTAENSKYRIHFIGATANLSNFFLKPSLLFKDSNYPTTFGWFCRYEYNSPLDPSSDFNDIGCYENNTNGFNKYTNNDLVVGNNSSRYLNRVGVSSMPVEVIGDVDYKMMDEWETVNLDFSEFVDDPNSDIDNDLASTEVTITFFARTNNALGANLHSYAYFGVECLGGGLPEEIELEIDDLVISCKDEVNESCISTVNTPAIQISNTDYSFYESSIEESLDGVSFGPTDDTDFEPNFTTSGIAGFSYEICLDEDDPPSKFYRITLTSMHQTIQDTFQIFKGFFYNDPVCPESSTNEFVGGDVIGEDNLFLCKDSELTPLVYTDPCFEDPNYIFSWWIFGAPIVGETGPSLNFDPDLLNPNTCRTKVTRKVQFTDPYCGTSELYSSEIFNLYNLNGYRVVINDHVALMDTCFGVPIEISIDAGLSSSGTCSNDEFVDFIEANDLDEEEGSISYSLFIDDVLEETITEVYLDGVDFESQNIVFTPIFDLLPGVHTISYTATSNFNGCENSEVYILNYSDRYISIAPISVGGAIEIADGCNPININSVDDGDSSGDIYGWEYAYSSDFSDVVYSLAGQTGISIEDLNSDIFTSFPVFIRRISNPFPSSFQCEDNVIKYSNVVEVEACTDCVSCVEAFEEVYENLQPTEICGEFTISMETPTLDCYTVVFHWVENVELTDEPFSFAYTSNGTYTVAISVYDQVTGKKCYEKKFDLIVDCFEECMECVEAFELVYSNLESTEVCGQYVISVPVSVLECYSVEFNWIENDQLTDEPFTFSFASNGTYSVAISIYDLVTGEKCYKKKFELVVDCFEECIECPDAFGVILDNLVSTEVCGEYEVSVPISILECYSVVFHWTENVGLTDEPFTFSYDENGVYSIAFSIFDLVTGEKCFEKKIELEVFCFDDDECQEDPELEELLAEHLKNILNAILELENGYTGICISGSSSTWVNISTIPEVEEFMDEYNLEVRLQNAIDIREELYGSYPYYTVDIQNVYYKWGSNSNGNPPCLTIDFLNETIGSGPRFQYKISGGMDAGVPISDGLDPNSIEEFTNVEINVSEMKASIEYTDIDGNDQSIYDILWPYTIVEGSSSGLKYCWFHDLDFTPEWLSDDETSTDSYTEINGNKDASTPIPIFLSLEEENISSSKSDVENDLIVFPNPAKDRINIELTKDVIEQVSLFNTSGQKVKSLKSLVEPMITLKVENLPSGIYFLKVQTTNKEVKHKRIVLL